jgi:hypothetical protein
VKLFLVICPCLIALGCATSTIESRKKERLAGYIALPADQRRLVDQGQIKVGMSTDAVFIAWGPPSEILDTENEQGHWTTWVYHGQVMEESRYWTYRETARDGITFLERHLESDYFPRSYVRAEINFQMTRSAGGPAAPATLAWSNVTCKSRMKPMSKIPSRHERLGHGAARHAKGFSWRCAESSFFAPGPRLADERVPLYLSKYRLRQVHSATPLLVGFLLVRR